MGAPRGEAAVAAPHAALERRRAASATRAARGARALLAAVALAGCAALEPSAHVPPFARAPYEPFSRDAAVAIALREWRAFGARVDDAPPDPERETPSEAARSGEPGEHDATPERAPGLWQRVGEYWWLGQDAGSAEAAWTGRHAAGGTVFPAERDGDYAWSAAFVSYVMRSAGARDGFPYAASHATYVNAAHERPCELRIRAERPEEYPPRPGDLICMGRERSAGLRFDDLPADFAGHCDLVVAVAPWVLTVVGGNVGDSVTVKHVPVTDAGTLATPDARVVDARYPWFVVVRVLYDR